MTQNEEANKMQNFIKNKQLIETHNNIPGSISFKLKENSRIHLSASEFKEKFLLKSNVTSKINRLRSLKKIGKKRLVRSCQNEETQGNSINWIDHTGPVRDQLNCGSCYAFTSVYCLLILQPSMPLFKIQFYLFKCSSQMRSQVLIQSNKVI